MEKWMRQILESGQVSIPAKLRDRLGIEEGDEIVVREKGGAIVMEPSIDRDRMVEGYRQRAERDAAIAEEMKAVSREATDDLGKIPKY